MLPMTDYKFCDVHKSQEKRQTPKESVRRVIVEQWFKVRGTNVLFTNTLDVCLPCLTETLVDRAKGLGIDFQNGWRTNVWQTGKSGKRFSKKLSMDEYVEYLEDQQKQEEMQELRARASGR